MTPTQRKKIYKAFAALISALIMGFFGTHYQNTNQNPTSSDSKNYSATVNKVSDGDTVRVTDSHGQEHKIRLAFIDAPETKQTHGQNSKAALTKMVDGKTVNIEVIDIDQYRREVARILINGQDANLAQIENGHAWHYQSIAKRNQPKNDYARYESAQTEAQKKRKGLWHQKDPLAPWTFRKERRQGKHSTESK